MKYQEFSPLRTRVRHLMCALCLGLLSGAYTLVGGEAVTQKQGCGGQSEKKQAEQGDLYSERGVMEAWAGGCG